MQTFTARFGSSSGAKTIKLTNNKPYGVYNIYVNSSVNRQNQTLHYQNLNINKD